MKKYLILFISLIFILSITACKSPEAPKLTVAERAGTYTCTDVNPSHAGNVLTLVINVNGSIVISGATFSSLDPKSTDTVFIVTDRGNQFKIDFDNNTLTGIAGSDNQTYKMTKNN